MPDQTRATQDESSIQDILDTLEQSSNIPDSTIGTSTSVIRSTDLPSIAHIISSVPQSSSLSDILGQHIELSAHGALTLSKYATECDNVGISVGEMASCIIQEADKKHLWTYLNMTRDEYMELLGVEGHLGGMAKTYEQTKERQVRWENQIITQWGSDWRDFMGTLLKFGGEQIMNAWMKLANTGISIQKAKELIEAERHKRIQNTTRARQRATATLMDVREATKRAMLKHTESTPGNRIEDLGDLTLRIEGMQEVDKVCINSFIYIIYNFKLLTKK